MKSTHRALSSTFAASLMLFGIFSCDDTGTTDPTTPPTSPTDDPGSSPPRLTDSDLKPVLSGLVVTEPNNLDTVPYARFGTIKVYWSDIEPLPGLFDFSPIDDVLEAHPDVAFRLRLHAGRDTPAWLSLLTGGCTRTNPLIEQGGSGCVSRFWTEGYQERYAVLMATMASRYDDNPQIVEVVNSACSTIFAEPFILGADDESVEGLWDAGLRKENHQQCLERTTADMMNVFDHTRVSIAAHTRWQYLEASESDADVGVRAASWEDERDLLNEMRDQYGGQLVIEEHGLGPDDNVCPTPGEPAETASTLYCYMAGLAGTDTPHGWQFTLKGQSMSDAAWAGVEMGACWLEFAAFGELDADERSQVHEALVDNCQFND